ncbi:MAG TPA: RNA polymerase sigma factor [Candidatus Sulfopaludibacter sp.]|nr:RNA polymerase sigma factor [Candidatus Sulfopaludibacter sp.]
MLAYHDHAAALLRFGTQLTGCPDLARDAVQEAFLRYFTELRFGRKIENPGAWLYQVLRNYVLDRAKAAPNQREVAADLDALTDLNREDPEEMVQRSQAARQVKEHLSPREFTCFSLRKEGLSYIEIADAMSIRIGTVGALMTRVQQKLRRASTEEESTGLRSSLHLLFRPIRGQLAVLPT